MHRPTALRRRSMAVLCGAALSLAAACSSGSTGSSGVAAASTGVGPSGVESATTAPPAIGTAATTAKGTGSSVATTVSTLPASAVTAPDAAKAKPVLAQVRVQLHQLGRFDEPVGTTFRPADPHPGRIYVVQRGGLINAIDADGTMAGQIADLQALTAPGGERGLLGLAFSPDGGRLYVNYTDLNGDTNVDELQMRPDGTADAASRRRLLLIKQPFANHNGGHLAFGPDQMLYIGMGDGGSGGDPSGNGQNLATLLGKLLRIDPTPDPKAGGQPYTVPADNPFVGKPGARPEIWSYGLRNPWGFSFDTATGDLWIGDVGQDKVEEVDLTVASAEGAGKGVNYGWGVFEGSSRYNAAGVADGAVGPVYEYDHGSGVDEGCSITGGVVYRQNRIANLTGAYLFADYCVAGLRAIPAAELDGARTEKLLLDQPANVTSIGLDGNGDVLITSLDGSLYRLEAQN